MPFFSANKIASEEEAVAAELVRARTQKKLGLDRAAADLKINPAYLEALEAGDFHKLPAGVYARNFLREYADYLGLNGGELAGALAGAEHRSAKNRENPSFGRRTIKNKTWELSRILKNAAIGLLALLCFAYLGYYLSGVLSPPRLVIETPAENLATVENTLVISGQTEPEAAITINGGTVLTDNEGRFTKELSLKSGLNSITIAARKKYGRQTVVQRQILVQK